MEETLAREEVHSLCLPNCPEGDDWVRSEQDLAEESRTSPETPVFPPPLLEFNVVL